MTTAEMKAAEQERVENRNKRASLLPPALAEARTNAMILSDVKIRLTDSAVVLPEGARLPLASMSGAIMAHPSPFIDNTVAHASRVRSADVVGNFCGVPIVTLDTLGMDVDAAVDQNLRLRNSSGTSIAPELLPGETIGKDNIIHREGSQTETLRSWVKLDRKVHLLQKGDTFAVSTVLLRKGYYAPRRFTGDVITAVIRDKDTGAWERTAVKVYADDFIFLEEGETNPEEVYTTHVGNILYKEFPTQTEASTYAAQEVAEGVQ